MENEQLQIKEYRQAMELLDYFKQRIESGEVMSMLIICEMTSGEMAGGTTATQNVYSLAGYMMTWLMRRLGFVERQ